MQVFHTAGVPPSRGSIILPTISSRKKSRVALHKSVRAKTRSMTRGKGASSAGEGQSSCAVVPARVRCRAAQKRLPVGCRDSTPKGERGAAPDAARVGPPARGGPDAASWLTSPAYRGRAEVATDGECRAQAAPHRQGPEGDGGRRGQRRRMGARQGLG